jgi:hypothetical protein
MFKKQIGDNGHIENAWTHNILVDSYGGAERGTKRDTGKLSHSDMMATENIRQQILQLSYQFTRCNNKTQIENVVTRFKCLIQLIIIMKNSNHITVANYYEFIVTLYKLIAQTRDIILGKGECELSYHLLKAWYFFYPDSAKFLLKCFVNLSNGHPYGSWKDIRNIASLCVNDPDYQSLVEYCVELINTQLKYDAKVYFETQQTVSFEHRFSLVSKWIPREKSKHGWLFDLLAEDYYKEYLESGRSSKASLKCKTHYRKLISEMNKQLDTVQIKQCANNWKEIDPYAQTSITLLKQSHAFLREDGEHNDRTICSNNFKTMIHNSTLLKGMRISMADLVKRALKEDDPHVIELLNSQWNDNSLRTGQLRTIIPFVGSIREEFVHSAIGLSIRIASKTIIGERIMTFGLTPSWIQLENNTTFVEKVKHIQKTDWYKNSEYESYSDFYSALNILLKVIIENKMCEEDVKDMTLVLLSDMRFTQSNYKENVYEVIAKMYVDAGIASIGIPYTPPHIVFWNLESTNGFPTTYFSNNCSMISGHSETMLNLFMINDEETINLDCKNGNNPFFTMIKSLSSKRYSILENYWEEMFA